MKAISLIVIVGFLCFAASAQAGNPATVSGFTRATRAINHPVLCATSERRWESLAAKWNAPGAIAFWVTPFIFVDREFCSYLKNWRTADPYNVSLAIFVLAHESGHADQQAEGKPYNENDADCRGFRKYYWLKRRLGITRHLPAFDKPHKSC